MQLSDRTALAAAAFSLGVVAAEALRWLLNRRTGAHAALLLRLAHTTSAAKNCWPRREIYLSMINSLRPGRVLSSGDNFATLVDRFILL